MKNEKTNKIEKLDDLLKSTGEQLIDYNEESNSKFQAIRDQVINYLKIKEDKNFKHKNIKNNNLAFFFFYNLIQNSHFFHIFFSFLIFINLINSLINFLTKLTNKITILIPLMIKRCNI